MSEARGGKSGEVWWSGETYRMGQKLELKLAEANPASGALRFELPEGKFGGPPRERKDRVRTAPRRGRPGNIRHQVRRSKGPRA